MNESLTDKVKKYSKRLVLTTTLVTSLALSGCGSNVETSFLSKPKKVSEVMQEPLTELVNQGYDIQTKAVDEEILEEFNAAEGLQIQNGKNTLFYLLKLEPNRTISELPIKKETVRGATMPIDKDDKNGHTVLAIMYESLSAYNHIPEKRNGRFFVNSKTRPVINAIVKAYNTNSDDFDPNLYSRYCSHGTILFMFDALKYGHKEIVKEVIRGNFDYDREKEYWSSKGGFPLDQCTITIGKGRADGICQIIKLEDGEKVGVFEAKAREEGVKKVPYTTSQNFVYLRKGPRVR